MIKVCFVILILICTKPTHSQTAVTDSLLKLLPASKEDTNKVNLLRNLTGVLRFNEPGKAVDYGLMGIRLSKKLQFDKGTAACYLNVSTAYGNLGKFDTTLLYLDTALFYVYKVGDPNRIGLTYLNRADLRRQLLDFPNAIKDCDTALVFAEKANNDDVRARVYQTIGAVYYRQEIYDQSIAYNEKSIALHKKNGNRRMTAIVLNNIALPYKSVKNYTGAIDATKEAIRITDSLQDFSNLSLFHGNLSNIYFLMEHYPEAEKSADEAIKYANVQQNENLWAAMLYKAEVYLKRKDYPQVINLMSKALPVFKAAEHTENIYFAADILAEAYYATGNFAKAVDFMKVGKEANDSLIKWKYDDDLAVLQTKFKVDEKDKAIQLMAKDKELQKQKLRQQWLLMIAASSIALLVIIGAWLLLNRYKLKQRMKELQLRNQIAADLHDEVGSSLSSINMLSLMAAKQENEITRNDILTKMSSNARETMDKMGDIVWMIKPDKADESSLKSRTERFAYEICSSKNIEVSIQADDLDNLKFSMEQRNNIYLIFKEALNNAVKYSDTQKIEIVATVHNKKFILQVIDFGKGYKSSTVIKGNGLNNMQHRAKSLGAFLEISSEQKEGTVVSLTLPL